MHEGELEFTIVTTEANAEVGRVHPRMAVVLTPADAEAWLAAPRTELLQPAPNGTLVATAVGDHVNSIGHDGPDCLAPAVPRAQLKLF